MEKKVEEETGYNRENVAQDYKLISADIDKLEPGSAKYIEMIEQHRADTAEAREIERVAVDSFNESERRITRNEYNKKNSESIEKLGIKEKELQYQSSYAPMLLLELTVAKIKETAHNDDVVLIDYLEELKGEDLSLDSAIRTVEAHTVRDSFGYTGSRVKMGQYETTMPHTIIQGITHVRMAGTIASTSYNHSQYVANIMHTIAPHADLYSMGMDNNSGTPNPNFYQKIEALIDAGVNVINMSAGFNVEQNRTNWYTNEERWVDHIEGPHGISFVIGAGDEGDTHAAVSNPAMAYNAITVGYINDNNTYLDESDDTFGYYSSYANNGSSDCAKPDVLAPGNMYDVEGTSGAAPVVSGVIAQLMEYKPALKTNSRLVKAVLSASCDRKINEPIYGNSGLTACEGAGIINARLAYLILANGRYASGSFSTLEKTFNVTCAATTPRIALAWARLNSVPSGHLGNVTSTAPYVNLDLYVYKPDGSFFVRSSLATSSAEMVCFNNTWETYTVKIIKADPAQASNTVWYSLAWR